MAADSASLRVLAVDDLEPIRTVIDQVLTNSGYRVDVAASLGEARAMNPGGYDVILVDAFLGQERGADLIKELVAADPAAARRCLLVTGGRLGEAPPGVARLGKPFGPDDLISAVRALHQEDPAGPAAPGTASTAALGPAPVPASSGPAEVGARADAPQAAGRQLLLLARRLRAAERGATADFVHDGPIQDLTSAMLSLRMAARPTDREVARQLGEVQRQLDAAARSLRMLAEAESAFGLGVTDLADTVRRHAAWLPFSSISLDVRPAGAARTPGRASLTADLVELALFALGEHLPGGRAEVTVRAGKETVEIELRLSPADGTPAGIPDTATATASLTELARALGGTAHYAAGGLGWQATITVPVGT